MKKIVIASLGLIFLLGCSGKVNELSKDRLRDLVIRASSGSRTANDSLSGIFSMTSIPGLPQNLVIDTLTISGRKFFGAAVEYSNPVNNRFALYDEYLNCFLMDKSLNGRLQLGTVAQYDFRYYSLEESFLSSDSIELKRLSVYRGDTSGFNLSFRTFTMMKTSDTVFIHDLYEITPDMIRARISAPQFSGINNISEDYLYDTRQKKYTVKKSVYFDEFVTEFISTIKDTAHSFITPAVSILDKNIGEVFEFTNGEVPEYYMSLDENWRELRNKPGGDFLKKEVTGSKFVNDRLKSNVYVFKIPLNESAEDYLPVSLDNSVKGKYTVRYSGEIADNEYIKKYFEYSCSTKKFLVILSAAKNTYDVNKQEYSDIINTFFINC